jgi:hypothetical protein
MPWRLTYLYRGTTVGWPGYEDLRATGMTPTTTDPVVATLFAVESRNHGQATLLLAERTPLETLVGEANHFANLECAINLRIQPLDFFRVVARRVEVDRSLAVLASMGFDQLPSRLRPGALTDALRWTESISYRLSPDAIQQYNRLIFEDAHDA